MGQRGPVKGSRRLEVVKGGEKSNSSKQPPKPKAKRPSAPKWLPPEARKLWRKIVPELEAMGLLKETDGAGLAALTTHYAILAMAVKGMKGADGKFQITVADPEHPSSDGQPAQRKNPLLSVIANHSEKLKAWTSEFAATPAARARLNIQPPKAVSALAEFLKKKQG
jgi:P27 family predicted phage terminase small subunit